MATVLKMGKSGEVEDQSGKVARAVSDTQSILQPRVSG